jgi:hypothetical protein
MATALVELLTRLESTGRLELQFLRHNPSGVVHVLWPADPDAEGAELTWAEAAELSVSPIPTLCGYQGRRDGYYGGADPVDEPVGTFPDEALCMRCHRALGPWQHKAFEHPVGS